MNSKTREQLRNAEFFQSVFEIQVIRERDVSAEFSRAEIAYWAMVGLQIGYLNQDFVDELCRRNSAPIASSCEFLQRLGQFPFPLPTEWPAAKIDLSDLRITIKVEDVPEWLRETPLRARLWETYQNLLLLIRENL